jgi:hypothetical protein
MKAIFDLMPVIMMEQFLYSRSMEPLICQHMKIARTQSSLLECCTDNNAAYTHLPHSMVLINTKQSSAQERDRVLDPPQRSLKPVHDRITRQLRHLLFHFKFKITVTCPHSTAGRTR